MTIDKQTEEALRTERALKLALDVLTPYPEEAFWFVEKKKEKAITAIRSVLNEHGEALAEQPAQDNTYSYAKNLAEAIFKQHFASDEHYASGRIVWGVNDTVIGILTQIDNMVADMVRRPAQQQEPVAYDKTEINCFAQDLYDQKMREGKHGHYESMFHAIHQCIKKVSPPASKPWAGLTDEEVKHQWEIWRASIPRYFGFAKGIEAKLREKNA